MGVTKEPRPFGLRIPLSSGELVGPPARSPGSTGSNDAGQPGFANSARGDTGGPAGTSGDRSWMQANTLSLGHWSSRLSTAKLTLTEFEDFKAQVLAEEIAMRTRRGRVMFEAVPENELTAVDGSHDKKLRKEAAAKLALLLTAARADLKAEQAAFGKLSKEQQESARKAANADGSAVVTDVKRIWIVSAYRDFKYDESKWHGLFKSNYYPKTRAARAALPGGEHGREAVKYLAKHISGKKAPPGFSNHSNGKAVDFGTLEGAVELSANVDQNARWKKAWLHRWLVKRHQEFGFKPLATEAWHWDFVQ
jgi:LAS superfamily LD-carboxypeptidase LdcB